MKIYEENGLFKSECIQVNFGNAERTKDEYTVTVNVELTEI